MTNEAEQAEQAEQVRRVLLVINESSPLEELWRALLECSEGMPTEVITVFLSDDRWRRAASLPFTREISRLSGLFADFTHRRAERVDEHAVEHLRTKLGELAADKGLQFVFEILSEHETARVQEVVHVEQDILIAPSVLEDRPVFAELARLIHRIMLVDVEDRVNGNANACRTGRQ